MVTSDLFRRLSAIHDLMGSDVTEIRCKIHQVDFVANVFYDPESYRMFMDAVLVEKTASSGFQTAYGPIEVETIGTGKLKLRFFYHTAASRYNKIEMPVIVMSNGKLLLDRACREAMRIERNVPASKLFR